MDKIIRLLKAVVFYAVVAGGSMIMLLPFIWVIVTSLKLPAEVILYPPTWIPSTLYLSNFATAWQRIPFMRYYLNSAVVTLIATTSSVFLSSMAGLAFAKYKFPGRNLIFLFILSALMIPFQITMIPLYLLLAKLNWVNTYYGVVAPSLGSAFGVFLMRQYMLSIPDELLDAGRIDGCSEFRIFWTVVMPLCKPAMATLAIFMFIANWNDFLWPLIVIDSIDMRTLPLGLAVFYQSHFVEYGPLAAASVMVLAPILVLFVSMEKRVIEGITLTGLKG